MYGCISDVMDLTCDVDETLFIVEAFYGNNPESCASETCCAPDTVNDCRASVSDTNEQEWLRIRSFCNYESSCVYQYHGDPLSECGACLADYMELTYTCASGTSKKPINIVAF